MKNFNYDSIMIIPSPIKQLAKDNIVLVKECFCPNGHNLVSELSMFDGHSGINLKLQHGRKKGLVALSPFYGDNRRIAMSIDLEKDEILDFHCPVCNELLPVFSQCTCGASLITLFNTPEANFSDCIGVCNRVDCQHSVIKSEGELISIAMVDAEPYIQAPI